MTQPFISPFADVPPDDVEAAELAAAQLAEYSKWEASVSIAHGNALAYLEGHAIPTSNVERLGYAKRGQARLSNEWIERNPEDPDVQRFTAFADQYPDHPDVRRYKRYREDQDAARERERESAVPNPFADDDEPKPAAPSGVSSAAGVPTPERGVKPEDARKPARSGRGATNSPEGEGE